MATDAQTLVNRTRRFVRDMPLEQLPLSGSLSNSLTTVTLASNTNYSANDLIEVDAEIMLVTALVSTTQLTVIRGVYGSTAVTHAVAANVVRRPAFFTLDIMDALNQAIQASFPRLYKEVVDESTTLAANQWEYTIPNMASPVIPIPFISEIQVRAGGDIPFKEIRSWTLLRGATPKIKFRRAPQVGDTMRVRGYGPFPILTALTDTLDTQFPTRCEYLLPIYAAGTLLEQGEAGRVRSDRGMSDDREQANRTGSALSVGAALLNRFWSELDRMAMAPIGKKHVKSVI